MAARAMDRRSMVPLPLFWLPSISITLDALWSVRFELFLLVFLCCVGGLGGKGKEEIVWN